MAVSLPSCSAQVFLYFDVFTRRHPSTVLWYNEQFLRASFFQDCDVQTLTYPICEQIKYNQADCPVLNESKHSRAMEEKLKTADSVDCVHRSALY